MSDGHTNFNIYGSPVRAGQPRKGDAREFRFQRNEPWRRLDVSLIETSVRGSGVEGVFGARSFFGVKSGIESREDEVMGDRGQDKHEVRADKLMCARSDGRLDGQGGRSGSLVPRNRWPREDA
jgi:hypothetical protein